MAPSHVCVIVGSNFARGVRFPAFPLGDGRNSDLRPAKKPAIYYCIAKFTFYALQQFADTVARDSNELNPSEETSDDAYGFGPDTGERQAHA
jgi:hypothetical protein